MKFSELEAKINRVFQEFGIPTPEYENDNYGQLLIYTGLQEDDVMTTDPELVTFTGN